MSVTLEGTNQLVEIATLQLLLMVRSTSLEVREMMEYLTIYIVYKFLKK